MTAERFAVGALVGCLVVIGGLFFAAIIYSVRMLGPDGTWMGLLALACLLWFGAALMTAKSGGTR